MNEQQQLASAIAIAARGHEEQYDRGGHPYILHPLKLMHQLSFDIQLATIAVLHDVVEDTDFSLRDLRDMGMSTRVLLGVDLLTHKPEETYVEYIEGICTNYDAIRVKRKDLEHNSDITRLKGVGTSDLDRMMKYHTAFTRLTDAKRSFLL